MQDQAWSKSRRRGAREMVMPVVSCRMVMYGGIRQPIEVNPLKRTCVFCVCVVCRLFTLVRIVSL
jgi:hypothetical protein